MERLANIDVAALIDTASGAGLLIDTDGDRLNSQATRIGEPRQSQTG
jgi:hypothetical protein